MLATARPIRPGSREHQQQQRQQQQQQRQQILKLEKLLIDDARLLARRDDAIDQAIETQRQTALEAFWQWQDGNLPLAAVIATAEPLQKEVNRVEAQKLLEWLRSNPADWHLANPQQPTTTTTD